MPRPYVVMRPILTELNRDAKDSEALIQDSPQQTALGINAALQKYLRAWVGGTTAGAPVGPVD